MITRPNPILSLLMKPTSAGIPAGPRPPHRFLTTDYTDSTDLKYKWQSLSPQDLAPRNIAPRTVVSVPDIG